MRAQRTPANPYTGSTPVSPSIDDGTIRPVSFWTPIWDHFRGHEREYGRAILNVHRIIHTHNAVDIYSLANFIDGIAQGWIATKDTAILDDLLGIIEQALSMWKPENELLSGIQGTAPVYGDTYMSMDNIQVIGGAKVATGQSPQNEAQFGAMTLYFVCHAKLDAGVQANPTRLARVQAIQDWMEKNMFEKWWSRRNAARPDIPGWAIVEQPPNLDASARWASICVLLRQAAGDANGLVDPANWARIEDISYKLVESYTTQSGQNRGLKNMILPHRDNPNWLWWPRLYTSAGLIAGTGDDVGHSSLLVKYICTAFEFGYDGWTQAHIDQLATFFKEALWDQNLLNPKSCVYIDGTGAFRNDWLQHGWFDLAIHESNPPAATPRLAEIFQNKTPWPTNFWSQHAGVIMHIADELV